MRLGMTASGEFANEFRDGERTFREGESKVLHGSLAFLVLIRDFVVCYARKR